MSAISGLEPQVTQFHVRLYNPETDRDWMIQEQMSAYISLLSLSEIGANQLFQDLTRHIDSFDTDTDDDDQKKRLWVISTTDGQLAGCVAVEIKLKLDIVTDELYWSSDISALLVSEGFRRRRLATEMMALAEKELAPDGSEPEEYTLEVHRECSDARALYESLGYDSYGTREIDHYDRHLVTDFMRKNAAT